jgi:hypothetical protein
MKKIEIKIIGRVLQVLDCIKNYLDSVISKLWDERLRLNEVITYERSNNNRRSKPECC